MKIALIAAAISLAAPAAADPFENFGTAMKYGLPLAAAVCAERQDRLEDFAVRGLLQVAVVYAMKRHFDGQPISRRPSGEGEGFPRAIPPRPFSARRIWRGNVSTTRPRPAPWLTAPPG